MSVLHNPPTLPRASTAIPIRSLGSAESGFVVVESVDSAEALLKLRDEFKHLPEGERRQAVRRSLLARRKKLDQDRKKLDAKYGSIASLKRFQRIHAELQPWLEGLPDSFKLQKPTPGATQDLRAAILDGYAFDHAVGTENIDKPEWRQSYEREIFSTAQVFIVDHDWAGAFKKSDMLNDAQYKLPYEVCCFEFQISGRRVVSIAVQAGEAVHLNLAIEAREGWDMCSCADLIVGKQIAAICIALDAEIATTEVTRVPHLRNAAPSPAPMGDAYHVVSLARRPLARPLPAPDGAVQHGRRLHFRRGHWRHLEKHKVWVKWCLCGDADLGFVDKHYRL